MRSFTTETTPVAEIADAIAPPARAADAAAEQSVREIVTAVRQRGDEAVVAYSREFDWPQAHAASLRVPEAEIGEAADKTDERGRAALQTAIARVRAFHERQIPRDVLEPDGDGALLGWRHTPIESVGVYAPATTAPLVSSLIMAAVPAQVAGVPRIAVATPPARDGSVNPGILAAAAMLGITEVYRMGGAQAIAALAFGTATVSPVDKIVGPGTIYGNLAKAMVAGVVGIDGFYGPSEVVILADAQADPRFIAADLAAQAEHQVDSLAVLVTPCRALVKQVEVCLEQTLEHLGRAEIVRRCLDERGAGVVVRDMEEAIALANRVAPEHLELMVAEPQELMGKIRNAGCILLGSDSPTAVSDYLAGPSHVLPTGRSARFSSGLGVMDFLKRSSVVQAAPGWLARHGSDAERLAQMEGLEAHRRSVRIRTHTDER